MCCACVCLYMCDVFVWVRDKVKICVFVFKTITQYWKCAYIPNSKVMHFALTKFMDDAVWLRHKHMREKKNKQNKILDKKLEQLDVMYVQRGFFYESNLWQHMVIFNIHYFILSVSNNFGMQLKMLQNRKNIVINKWFFSFAFGVDFGVLPSLFLVVKIYCQFDLLLKRDYWHILAFSRIYSKHSICLISWSNKFITLAVNHWCIIRPYHRQHINIKTKTVIIANLIMTSWSSPNLVKENFPCGISARFRCWLAVITKPCNSVLIFMLLVLLIEHSALS